MAKVINGDIISQTIRDELKVKVQELVAKYHRAPGLAVILVGTRGDSATYVRLKKRRAAEVGIIGFDCELAEDVTMEELLGQIKKYNDDDNVDGILVQLPLPNHIDEKSVILAIRPDKDVDGLHPVNAGKLVLKTHTADFVPCTPKGVIALLDYEGIEISGKRAVVIGRSDIVGIPISQLLLQRNATVTVCHSKTQDIPSVVREADIVVCATGKPKMVKADWIKKGAAVIDVGTTPVDDPTKKSGKALHGDVDYESVKEVAGWITPVPGGVGPMTIAMLLSNTVERFERVMKAAAATQ